MTTAVRLRSDDPPAVRAANIAALAGIDTGDQRFLADQQREIARAIAEYQKVDAEARQK